MYPAYDLDNINLPDSVTQARTEIFAGGRPTNFINTMMMATTFWQPYAVMDFYRQEVSILATIVSRSQIELLRYGVDWQPLFVRKCVDCGRTYQENVRECETCHSKHLVEPDEFQKDYFVRPNGTSFIDEANDSGQSLKAILQAYCEEEYIYGQGYMLCITGDCLNEDGSIDKSYPLEFVCKDPKYVKKMFDESAVLGKTVAFSPMDRSVAYSLDAYPDQMLDDGTVLIPAFYRVGSQFGAVGEVWHYSREEMYSDQWFSQSETYGVPPWLDIEDDLLSYHFIEKHFLKRTQYGYVRGILVFPGFSRDAMQNLAKSIQQVLAKNDNSIPMVGLPPAVAGAGEQKVQFVSISNDNASDIMQLKNDIRDRCCARVGVPNMFVTDTENSGGLNSESQQITVFDRYLMDKYDNLDKLLAWFIGWFDKITDWKLCVTRPPKMNTDLKEKMENAQYAMTMKNLGFEILSQRNGRFEFSDRPINLNNPAPRGGGPSFR